MHVRLLVLSVAMLGVVACTDESTTCESALTLRAIESTPFGDATTATWLFRLTTTYVDGRMNIAEITCTANQFSPAGEFFCDHVESLEAGPLSAITIEQVRQPENMPEQVLATHRPDPGAALVASEPGSQCYVYDVRIEAEPP